MGGGNLFTEIGTQGRWGTIFLMRQMHLRRFARDMLRRSETLGDDVWKTDPSREPHMALRTHRYTPPHPHRWVHRSEWYFPGAEIAEAEEKNTPGNKVSLRAANMNFPSLHSVLHKITCFHQEIESKQSKEKLIRGVDFTGTGRKRNTTDTCTLCSLKHLGRLFNPKYVLLFVWETCNSLRLYFVLKWVEFHFTKRKKSVQVHR